MPKDPKIYTINQTNFIVEDPNKKKQSQMDEFEKGYNSKYYFPQSNPDLVVHLYNQFQKRVRKT